MASPPCGRPMGTWSKPTVPITTRSCARPSAGTVSAFVSYVAQAQLGDISCEQLQRRVAQDKRL